MAISTRNMIFVFGSNLAGIHGSGAARYAREYRGAQMGIGEGRTGQSYAIPTKGKTSNLHTSGRTIGIGGTLPLHVIQDAVNRFLDHAREHSALQFQVTCIGCGLAGLRHSDIAPMFEEAPLNCYFDTLWEEWLGTNHNYWGTFGP